jgi:hypothetical protein
LPLSFANVINKFRAITQKIVQRPHRLIDLGAKISKSLLVGVTATLFKGGMAFIQT